MHGGAGSGEAWHGEVGQAWRVLVRQGRVKLRPARQARHGRVQLSRLGWSQLGFARYSSAR